MNKWLFRFFIGPLDPGMFKGKKQPEKEVKPMQFGDMKTGEPIGVLFGTDYIDENDTFLLWWGDLNIQKHKPDSDGGKK